jgi:hypothetical protein
LLSILKVEIFLEPIKKRLDKKVIVYIAKLILLL